MPVIFPSDQSRKISSVINPSPSGKHHESFDSWDSRLRKRLSKIRMPGILHSSLVGSHRFATSLNVVHDVDVLFIFRKFGLQQYLALTSQMAQIASDLTSASIFVFVETRSGPLKPNLPARDFYHVQLHVLPYDEDEWQDVLRYPGCQKWVVENEHLTGQALPELSKVPPLSVQSVLRDIAVLKQNLHSASAYSRVYIRRGNQLVREMESVPVTRDQYAQMLVSCALHAARNTTMVWSSDPSSNTTPVFPNAFKSMLREMNRLDSRLKRGDRLAVTSAIRAKRKIAQFLDWLEGDLSDFAAKER